MFDSETDRERRTPAKLTVKEQPDDFYERLAAALDARWERRREMILHVGGMLGEGAELGDVAGEMGLSLAQVREIVMEIAHVASELQVKT